MKKQNAKARERLVQTTGKLLRAQGYYATGLDEVLRRSSTPKGSLYHYFPGGKRQLADAAVRYMADRMARTMAEVLRSTTDPAEALQIFLDGRAEDLAASSFKSGCPIATVTLETASDDADLRNACSEGFENLTQIFIDHLVTAGISPERAKPMATLFIASWEGGLILSRARQDVEPLKAVARELATLMDAAVKDAACGARSFPIKATRKN